MISTKLQQVHFESPESGLQRMVDAVGMHYWEKSWDVPNEWSWNMQKLPVKRVILQKSMTRWRFLSRPENCNRRPTTANDEIRQFFLVCTVNIFRDWFAILIETLYLIAYTLVSAQPTTNNYTFWKGNTTKIAQYKRGFSGGM